MDELTGASWRKAKASQGNGSCVEVASLSGGRHAVRDSKANGEGPILLFTEAEWAAFLDGAKNGEFDS
jgi:Domain of unknown function (DUF397)